jgi:hypothetical protein
MSIKETEDAQSARVVRRSLKATSHTVESDRVVSASLVIPHAVEAGLIVPSYHAQEGTVHHHQMADHPTTAVVTSEYMVMERGASITRQPELTTRRILTSLASQDLVLLQGNRDTHVAHGTRKTLGIQEVVAAVMPTHPPHILGTLTVANAVPMVTAACIPTKTGTMAPLHHHTMSALLVNTTVPLLHSMRQSTPTQTAATMTVQTTTHTAPRPHVSVPTKLISTAALASHTAATQHKATYPTPWLLIRATLPTEHT